MNRKASIVASTAAAAVLILFATFLAFRDAAHRGSAASASTTPVATLPRAAPETSARPSRPTQPAQFAASEPARPIGDAQPLDEAALMNTLRELRRSDPNLILQLAREGNQRFKGSAGTAERSWFIVKALSDLDRHDEARVEGRLLV